ncbi:MAG TPA: mandelate racemase/muconate lactonizing enzyme family protein [Anaerolineae bacterium]|nr:mandelate racemase/muconate lactonizing enzyme family protein [Anaerolineae bacterium]HQH39484.1 mandelate racemase/muconate lactonizing enzyme family protein [Anaerolineae bacterium]
MKITDVKPYPVWVGHRNQMLVKVETDEGIYGWGEAGVSGRELAVAGAVKHYREFLIGEDPLRIDALWQRMYRSQYFEGGRILTGAISAIDIALHDIVGKALNVPVYQLLGGKQRDYVPCFATTGGQTCEHLLENVNLLLSQGWNVIRMGAAPGEGNDPRLFEPRESIGPTAEWFIKVRDSVGKGPVLGIDYHHRLSVAEAASFCQRMPSGTLDFIEEPIRDESPEAYEALRKMVDIPFAIGEEFASKWQFLPYIERGITNFARVDVCNVGGLTEAKKVAGWAEAHYIDLMPHNPLGPVCTAATVHLAAAVTNFAWLEVRVSPTEAQEYPDENVFPVQHKLEGSWFPVPNTPGLGIECNEEYLAHEAFKFWEAPHLHRRDGSYTNW